MGTSDHARIVGVWQLEEIEDCFEGKRGPAAGFESRPSGILIYLDGGTMSVNFAASSRIPFLREFSPTPSELSAAAAAYGGYAGRWELDERRHEVLHHVETGFVPNRVGKTIRRSYSFSENLLLLRPIALSPDESIPERVLRWRRRSDGG